MAAMELPDLLCELHGAVAWVVVNRPQRRNALGEQTTRQILQACEWAAQDPKVRALVLTGQGDAFCAGGDLEDTFARGAGQSEAQWSGRIRSGPNRLAQLLRSMAKPVIACVNGVAVGGGATIALACDLRIASENARFRFPFVHVGITPEFGCSYLLQRTVGLGRANELLLLGDFIDAETAERYGLVQRVLPQEALRAETQTLAERLAAQPAQAMARIKKLQLHAQSADLASTLEQEALALGQSFVSPEHRAVVEQFLRRKSGA